MRPWQLGLWGLVLCGWSVAAQAQWWANPRWQAYQSAQEDAALLDEATKAQVTAQVFEHLGPAHRGEWWFRQQDYTQAAQAFAEQVAGAEPNAEALYNHGTALAHSGDVAAAITALEQALEQDPGHADAAHNLEILRQAASSQNTSQNTPQDTSENSDASQDESAPEESSDSQGDAQNNSQGSPETSAAENTEQQEPAPAQESDASESDPAEPSDQDEPSSESASESASEPASAEPGDLDQQALEQWMRSIPDAGGSLLQRRILHMHQQQYGE